jgi:capsular exopolysaccharide synthesis family protein
LSARPPATDSAPWLEVDPKGDREVRVEDILDFARRHWMLAALLTIVGGGLGFLHYTTTAKQYRATATIQIERGAPLNLGGETSWLYYYFTADYYPTQYRLLQSRGMGERVVRHLRLWEDPRFYAGADEAGGEPPPEAMSRLGQRLVSGLSVEPIRGTQLVNISYRSSHADLTARIANGVVDEYRIWTAEQGSVTVGRASSFIAEYIEALKGEIQAAENRFRDLTDNQDITAIDPSSDITLKRLEALNQDYIEAVSTRIERESNLNELLNTPLDSLAPILSGPVIEKLRADQEALEREYAEKLRTFKPEWPEMVELNGQIERARQHMATVAEDVVARERRAARANFDASRRQEQRLRQEINRAKEEVGKLNSAGVEVSTLQMEVATKRTLLDNLLRQQSQTEVAARIQTKGESNIRVVDAALVPKAPYYPSLRRDGGTGLAAGLGLALALALLLDYLDRSIKSGEEAEKRLGLPVLGVIPDTTSEGGRYGGRYGLYAYAYGGSSKREERATRKSSANAAAEADDTGGAISRIELLPHRRPRHFISEGYRSLRTALLLSSAERLSVIALTSAQSGEGKTSTSVNLATVLVQLGHQVLLIDGDLRKPRMHKIFGLSNRVGLVGYLTSRDPSPPIQPTELAGLFVLPSGPVPPNPSELLASGRMGKLIEAAREKFRFVIIDTPPVLPVSDAMVVGTLADGVVLCIQCGRTLREEAGSAVERLRVGGVKILGLVLNRFTARGRGKGKRHYYYYQSYGEPESTASVNAADSAA